MSKKFFYFLLTSVLMISLTACNKTVPNSATNNNPTNSTNTETSTNSNTGANANITTAEAVNTGVDASGRAIPVNVAVGSDVTLASDIPVFPNAKLIDKRLTNKITTFIFSTDALRPEVENFYKDVLKKEGWSWRLEQQNVADGYYFIKPKRTVRVVAYYDGQEKKTLLRLSVFDMTKEEAVPQTMEIMGADGKPVKRVAAANLNDVSRMPLNLAATTPLYPGAQPKPTDKPGQWWEYRTKDPVKKIAEWYDKELKAIGWTLELDTSELGDSMIIYTKNNEKGDRMYIGIRVNDIKEKSERWITLINYPYNATIPHVDPITKVEKEQPEATKIAKDLAKKNQEKNSGKPDYMKTDITPKMLADVEANRQAGREKNQQRNQRKPLTREEKLKLAQEYKNK
jgi:hypothetical protein